MPMTTGLQFHSIDRVKIADINESDTNTHSTTTSALGLPENTVMIMVHHQRMAGTGTLSYRDKNGSWHCEKSAGGCWWIKATDGKWYYGQSVANDDFDVFTMGYFTQ